MAPAASQPFTTPMMKQYLKIKKQYQDCLLFYRMGDFYELFLEDAHVGARVLDITLTSRSKGRDGRIPMAGVPFHAVDPYVAKLVKAGYSVAICEQLTEPNNRGIVERDVIRIVTPGTMTDEKALDRKEHNYIISLALRKNMLALAAADISTGEFQVQETDGSELSQRLSDLLARLAPTECILAPEQYENLALRQVLRVDPKLNLTCFQDWDTYAGRSAAVLTDHFRVKTLGVFGLNDKPLATEAAAALLGYLSYTQKGNVKHLQRPTVTDSTKYMLLDRSTIINLELFSTIREQQQQGTLVSVLDQTRTAMGGRLLRTWIKSPLRDPVAITARLDAVGWLLRNHPLRKTLRTALSDIVDIERILARLAIGVGNARDIVNLQHALTLVLQVRDSLRDCPVLLVTELLDTISDELTPLIELVRESFVDEPPISVKDAGMIREGLHERVDLLRQRVGGGKGWMTDLEKAERERTGIGSLKVRYNKVFGFYIEVSKANVHLVPEQYQRKQTLVNGERFVTPELKEQEVLILSAEEELKALEFRLFSEILSRVLGYTTLIQRASQAIAQVDCLASFAETAHTYRYVRPELTDSGELTVQEGRHPVVERVLPDVPFVPNDVRLTDGQRLLIITGPNMAGKSVFIRQVALITLMAQIGCFVPAASARITPVDKLFVRSGASDAIAGGLSTFMVEMTETAYILNHATPQSLIVMDEIGRGTSTYDGISIAWAVAEYLVTTDGRRAKTLFATHYHELQALEQQYPDRIRNFHMSVIEEEGNPVFLHTLAPGGASHSFGVAVAQLAGVPDAVVRRAKTMLTELEQRANPEPGPQGEHPPHDIVRRLRQTDISTLTPLQALNILAELKSDI